MKYAELDMQEIPRQMSPLTQVQNNTNGIQDRNLWRSRRSDSTNNNGAKECPEVIDLDGEDSPVKEKVESSVAVNGVTFVKKVSLPWQDKKSSGDVENVENKSVANEAENDKPEVPSYENGIPKDELPHAPGEMEESLSLKAAEGGRIVKKKIIVDENCQVKKRTSSKKRELDATKKSKNDRSQVELSSSQSQGERKRPSSVPADDSTPKRQKIGDDAADESTPSSLSGKSQINGLARQSSEDKLEVVDLAEEEDEVRENDDELSKEVKSAVAELEKIGVTCTEAAPISPQTVDMPMESVAPSSPVFPVVATQASAIVSPRTSSPSDEKRTKSITSVIGTGTNSILSQMQSIEVKKVKLCPRLEKQATAMSAASSLAVSASVAMPKPPTASALVQSPVSTNNTSSPETASVPPSIVTAKLSTPESAKELLKECESVLSDSDLENKVGLNPAHSATRKLVKKLTRSELESFLLEMTCDLVFTKSDAGKYHQMYEEMKEISENKSAKIAHLTKQLADLSAVVHRVITESKEKKDIIPHRLTRSVGLQLDSNNIANAYKARARGEKLQVMAPSANSTVTSTSPTVPDRVQPQKWNCSATMSTSKTMPPPTPNSVATSPVPKEAPPRTPSTNRSPQRQLRALHPRAPPSSAQSNISPAPSSSPFTSASMTTGESPKKLQGFIDITEESKMLSAGAQVSVRRQRAPSLLVGTSPGNNGGTNVTINPLIPNQVVPSTLKMVHQQYGQTGNVYSQPGGSARVVTAASLPAGTTVSGSRLTYLIPTSSAVTVPSRQIVLAPTSQNRGRPPLNQGNSLQSMLMRPNTLVQVPTGAITSTPTSIMRTVPTNSLQVLTTAKHQQQQNASRYLAMQSRPSAPPNRVVALQHPAPLPAQPQPTVVNPNLKPIPRRPILKLSKVSNGIVLSWNMTFSTPHEEIASYQLYAYQEGANSPPSPSLWKKVGDVKALPLPMACTLTQFADGHTYHFAVRALDVHGRVGEFSVPGTIELN